MAKIWPEMAIASWQSNRRSGAYRLWILAKTIDTEGSGVVTYTAIRGEAEELGVNKRTWRRWISDALELGFFEKLDRRSGLAYRIVSHERGAEILGLSRITSRFTTLPTKRLFKKGWKAHAWAAYLTYMSREKKVDYHDKKTDKVATKIITTWSPISRNKLTEITRVPRATQYRFEKQAGVNLKPVYAASNIGGVNLDAAHEALDKPHAFINKWTGKVSWRLPTIHAVPKRLAQRGQRGRSMKINLALERANKDSGSLIPSVPLRVNVRRIFYDKATAAVEAANRWDGEYPGEIYAKQRPWKPKHRPQKRRNAVIFDVIPCI